MTLALFLVEAGRLAGLRPDDGFILDGDEGRHAATVRRIRAGERIDLADGLGLVAHCEVTAAGRDRLDLRVHSLDELPVPRVRLALAQALAKGGRDEQAVETATEVGVDVVLPWQAGRSVVRWQGERGEKALRRWEAVAREAAKQSRRPRIPLLEGVRSTPELARRAAESTLALVLHEAAKRPLLDVALPESGEVLVIVGPEGGISDEEVILLAEQGAAVPVRLGREVLRASTAGPVALGWLAARTGRWA
jgi:16S rRNA (uracil1498-N3)-methyltransferase